MDDSRRGYFPRTLEGEIEAAQAVAGKRVRAALQNDGRGVEPVHHVLNNLMRNQCMRADCSHF